MLRSDNCFPVCHFWPSFSISNKSNKARGHSSNDSKRMRRNSLRQQAPDVYHLLASKLACRLPFTAQINKPSFPLMLCVSGKTNPFQVFNSIVQLVSVDVIYGQIISISRHESNSDKTMYKMLDTLSVLFWRNLKITSFCQTWGAYFFRKVRLHCLSLSISCSFVLANVFWRLYLSIRANKPFNSLRLNFSPHFHDNSK